MHFKVESDMNGYSQNFRYPWCHGYHPISYSMNIHILMDVYESISMDIHIDGYLLTYEYSFMWINVWGRDRDREKIIRKRTGLAILKVLVIEIW